MNIVAREIKLKIFYMNVKIPKKIKLLKWTIKLRTSLWNLFAIKKLLLIIFREKNERNLLNYEK